jgi:mRNA interferase YafQ
MSKIVISDKFKKILRKFANSNPNLQTKIEETIASMENDLFSAKLGTHKLSGKLAGLFSCSCGYDCRIVFSLKIDQNTGEQIVLLLDIGTHDDVY